MRREHIARSLLLLLTVSVCINRCQALASSEIAGRVLQADGTSFKSQIHLYRLRIYDGSVEHLPVCDIETEAGGRFACPHLETGAYILQAVPFETAASGAKDEIPSGALFFPGVSDLSKAIVISVAGSESRWCEIQERVPRQRHSLSGVLGSVPQSAELRLQAQGQLLTLDTGIHLRVSAKQNSFAAEQVPDGTYLISADWRVHQIAFRAEARVTLAGSDIKNTTLTPVPSFPFVAHLQGPAAALVTMVTLYDVAGRLPRVVTYVKNGSVQVPALLQGRYMLSLPVHAATFIESVSSGSQTYDGPFVEVKSPTDVQVQIAENGSELVGTVPGASAETRSIARVVVVRSGTNEIHAVVSDASGRFSISGLPPGGYTLLAWPVAEDPPYRIPGVLSDLLSRGSLVSVGEHTRVDLGQVQLLQPPPIRSL